VGAAGKWRTRLSAACASVLPALAYALLLSQLRGRVRHHHATDVMDKFLHRGSDFSPTENKALGHLGLCSLRQLLVSAVLLPTTMLVGHSEGGKTC
jgi:hypothetical protein